MNRFCWYALIALCLACSISAMAQPQLHMKVWPRYVAAVPASSTLENPAAFFFEITGLVPNTAYEGRHMGYMAVGSTSTRGSKWTGSVWISPSTPVPGFKTTDATGKLASWVYLRPPTAFNPGVNMYRVRLRVFAADSQYTFDDQSPAVITALSYSPTAGDTTAGAIVYGYIDSVGVDANQKIVVAYENPTDTIPLTAWLMYKTPTTPVETELYNTRMDTTLRRCGYFQLVVPENVKIGKLELRDTNNVVIRTQTSTLWQAGAKGTATNLDAQQDIVLDVETRQAELPLSTQLAQNYPNPFNPTTSISYTLAKAGNVTLTVYDAIGRQVAVLVNSQHAAGSYSTSWNATGLSSGMYFYRLQGEGFAQTKAMVLMK